MARQPVACETPRLKGARIALPAPFGKDAAEERSSEWRMSLGGPEQRYWLDYAELSEPDFRGEPGPV